MPGHKNDVRPLEGNGCRARRPTCAKHDDRGASWVEGDVVRCSTDAGDIRVVADQMLAVVLDRVHGVGAQSVCIDAVEVLHHCHLVRNGDVGTGHVLRPQ